MTKITAILIEDELMPREVLRLKLLDNFKDIEIIGEASNIEQAYQLIVENEIDLIFLDVNMPNGSGFQLLKKFNNPSFETIFTTAYEEFALDAFKSLAIGYLVKPIKTSELLKVVHHAINIIELKKFKINNENVLNEMGTHNITIHTSDEHIVLKISDIVRCEGWEKYTYFFTKDKKILCTHNIGKYKGILEEHDFFLCHKSHIINKKMIESYHKDGFIILIDGTKIPLARRRKQSFIEMMYK